VFGIAELGESVDLQADVVRAARRRRTQHNQRPRVQEMQFQCRVQAVAGHVAEVTEYVEVPASQPFTDVPWQRVLLEVAFDLVGFVGVVPRITEEHVEGHAVE
jgi:hypothetical protein